MSERQCERCGKGLVFKNRQARFCSTRCRVAAHRARTRSPFPVEMTQARRWVRRDEQKRPLTVAGRMASSTDAATWSTFGEARTSSTGVGLGFVLGDGIGCYDLDHCFEDGRPAAWVREFAASIPEPVLFCEVSQSGEGVHIFIEAPECRGSRTVADGRSVERYTVGRYIAVTGDRLTL